MNCIYCKKELKENFDGECGQCNMPTTKNKIEAINTINGRYDAKLKNTVLFFLSILIVIMIVGMTSTTSSSSAGLSLGGFVIFACGLRAASLSYAKSARIKKIQKLL